ncbi:uncharacterized protein CG13380 isoform X1 [Drosophila bipectinata]|uniref:uncharacterized protein CG13380 isoform X1 n=1 Tax=Drosophila bipectinata TaxID=42026 RepID=UPI001C8A1F42|nr:uncharacterized protein CG13380 isoform X1 [Drosophila bipectinata]
MENNIKPAGKKRRLNHFPSDIAARLSQLYPDLMTYSPPRGVATASNAPKAHAQTEMVKEADGEINNNLATIMDMNRPASPRLLQEVTCEIPFENQHSPKCICNRTPIPYECGRCYQFIHGRLAEVCDKHPHEVFLMDFQQCPYCLAPVSLIKPSNLTLEQIRNIEEAVLPDDDDI